MPWTSGPDRLAAKRSPTSRPAPRENAGTVSLLTGGATVRALTTSLGGTQTVSIPADMGRHNERDGHAMAMLFGGVSRRHCPDDGGNNQGSGGAGNDVTLNTAGACE